MPDANTSNQSQAKSRFHFFKMLNAGGCSAKDCLDVFDPIRVRKLKEWAESDAKFLRKISMAKEDKDKSVKLSAPLSFIPSSEPSQQSLDERFAWRQKYLRSYRFGKDTDTILQRTKKWLNSNKQNNKKNHDEAKGHSCISLLKGGIKLLFSCIAQVDLRNS